MTEVPQQNLVVKMKNEIGQMAQDFQRMLPPAVPTDKFVRTIQTAITMNPEIAQADRNSVINACMKAASDGLILDGREAFMRIGNAKQKDGSYKKIATYIPMTAGIIKRVRNSGDISVLNAFVVYENDKFTVRYGLEMTLEHEPNFINPGKALGAYAVCKFKDGEVDFEYMPASAILQIGNASSNAHQYDPLKGASYGEWWRKTALRRLSKRLPMSSELANVIERIDEDFEPHETFDNETGEIIPAAEPVKPTRKKAGAGAAIMEQAKAVEPVAEAIPAGLRNVAPAQTEAEYTEMPHGQDYEQEEEII